VSLALVDGDIVAYRASVAAQEDTDWGDGNTGLTVNVKSACQNALSIARTWIEKSRCERAIMCFSDPSGGNFRKLVGPYKESRTGHKPECYWEVVDTLHEEWEVKSIRMLEADDVMGIYSTSPKIKGAVIVSIDKDMKTIPGKLLNPMKDKRPRTVSPYEADMFWMLQTLIGDTVDGYKGCPGIGPIKAERALAGAPNLAAMWAVVQGLYIAAGSNTTAALMNARFARILRREDYDKEKEEVLLWTPHKRKPERLKLRQK
jgi:DNA polymerase-1